MKFSEYHQPERKLILDVFKGYVAYRDLFDAFEKALVMDRLAAFVQFGDNCSIKEKQYEEIKKIHLKLML